MAVAAVAFAVFYWLEIWDESRADLLLIPVGLLTGLCLRREVHGVRDAGFSRYVVRGLA